MPVDKYFGGKGKEVKDSMEKQYGKKKGESVFYATAKKKKQEPKDKKSKKPKFFRA